MPYVYIIKCEDESLYTGMTTDIRRRMREHVEKSNKSKYTRSRKIKQLVALWECETKSSAARLEYAIKKLKRIKKLELAANPQSVNEMFQNLCDTQYVSLETFDVFELQN